MELLTKKVSFENVQSLLQQGDTDVTLKMGFVLIGKQANLVLLRDAIQKRLEIMGGQLVFYTFSSQPLYVVHFNDLNSEKQQSIIKNKDKESEKRIG